MNETKLHVGTAGFPIAPKQVLSSVNLVERPEARTIPPKAKTARAMRKDAPGDVRFTALLSDFLFKTPAAGTTLPGDLSAYGGFRQTEENLGLWRRCVEFCQVLEAPCGVMITPSDFRPTRANRDAFVSFLNTVDREGLQIVWERQGLWEADFAEEIAKEANLILAVDPLRDEAPAGPVAYFRLGAFAALGSRVGVYDLERMAEAALRFEEVYCVFDTNRALDDARNFQKTFAEMQGLED